jgi:hypothetical protein
MYHEAWFSLQRLRPEKAFVRARGPTPVLAVLIFSSLLVFARKWLILSFVFGHEE